MPAARRSFVASAAIAAAVMGCSSHKVYHPVTLQRAPGQAQINLLVREEHKVAPTGLDAALVKSVAESGMVPLVLGPEDVAATGAPSPAYLLTFHVDKYDAKPIKRIGNDPTAAVLLYGVFSWLIIPPCFIGLVRERTEQTLDFTVALQDLSQAEVRKEKSSVGPVYEYDASGVKPIFRKSYSVHLDEGRNWVKSEMDKGRRSMEEHRQEVARQYSYRMVNEVAPDVIEALSNLAAHPQSAPEAVETTDSQETQGSE